MSEPAQNSRWWANSEHLGKQVPELTTSRGWERFAAIYDDPKAVANRLAAVTASLRKRDVAAEAAIELAARLGGRVDLNSAFLLLSEDPEARREGAIKEMVGLLKRIFDPGNTRLVRSIAQEIEERISPPAIKRQMLADGIEAFRVFILRERRLPNREELSIEANRLLKSEWKRLNFADAHHFGEIVAGGYVYDTRRKSTSWETPAMIRLCPSEDWNKFRWEMNEVSRSIIGPGGLKSIPRKKRTVTRH